MSGDHGKVRGPATAPCGSCPYRRDVPSGVWAASEYDRLPDYDAPTALQPTALFLCHQADGRVCAGWVGCHGGADLLAIRLAALRGMDTHDVAACHDYVCPVPLFDSGHDAAAHGRADIDNPGQAARRAIARLAPKITARALDVAVHLLPVPVTPVDGDCLTWAPATATRLTSLGHPAEPIDVAGWTAHAGGALVFVHRTVLITDGPGTGQVIDVTARQFSPHLPARWVTDWATYQAALADATRVAHVTRWPDPGRDVTPPPPA